MKAGASREQQTIERDRCSRPVPQYNHFYNPYEVLPPGLPAKYSLYVPGEPLFNDRPCDIGCLKPQYTVAGAAKRVHPQWTWALGYAINNNSRMATKKGAPLLWICKLYTLFLLVYLVIYCGIKSV
jgi:hypothetical protein